MAVVQNLSAAAGTSAAGGDDVQIAPVVIGSILGTAVGVASGPLALIVGPAVSAAITQNINSNAGKPRPPLTSIDVTGNLAVSRHNPYFSSRQEVKKNDL
uniref:hypothetical protein n=1 Tax=Vibrio cholerae TaxID=666 RepID=UPI0002BA78CE|nr:hypothetical protein [Vibrio cholerae]